MAASYDTGTWVTARSNAVETFNEGVRAMNLGDEAQAISLWERTVEMDPTIAPALHNLILYHEARRAWPRVIALYDQLVSLDPFDTRALIRQASAFRHVARLAEAIRNYERAISLYPFFRIWYDELAELLEQAGRSEESAEWHMRAASLDTDEAEMAFEDGVRQLRQRNYDLAVACFEAVLEDFPSNLEARIRLANALAATDRLDDALSQLGRALDFTDIARPQVLYHRATLWMKAARSSDAENDLQQALTELPNYGRAREMLRLIQSSQGTARPSPSLSGSSALGRHSGNVSAVGDGPVAPWESAIQAILRRWAAVPGPTGQAPRVAILVEAHRALAVPVTRLLRLLDDPMLALRPDGSKPIWFAEVGELDVVASGWLGSPAYAAPRSAAWGVPAKGLPLDSGLSDVLDAGGRDGFNLVIVIATGLLQPPRIPLESLVPGIPCFQMVLLTPSGPGTPIAQTLAPLAPDWLELALE